MPSNLDEQFQTLHEIARAARRNLADGPWDYLVGGTETETTVKRNRAAIEVCKRCSVSSATVIAVRSRPRTSSKPREYASSCTRERSALIRKRIDRARFLVRLSSCEQSCSSCAATNSAAAEGVGARKSAAKSAIVKSVS